MKHELPLDPPFCPYCFHLFFDRSSDTQWICRRILTDTVKERWKGLAQSGTGQGRVVDSGPLRPVQSAPSVEHAIKPDPKRSKEGEDEWGDINDLGSAPAKAPDNLALPQAFVPSSLPLADPDQHKYCNALFPRTDANCPDCGQSNPKRPACGKCQRVLPPGWDEGGNVSLGIIGATGVGKDSFILAADQVMQKRLATFGLTCRLVDPDGRGRLMLDQLRKRRNLNIDATPDARGSAEESFVFRLTKVNSIRKATPGRGIDPKESFFLHFKNHAGENFQNRASMASLAPYLRSVRGLVFIIDPYSVAEPLSRSGQVGDRSGTSDAVLESLIDFMEEQKGECFGQTMPIAVCLNKWDEVRSKFRGTEKDLIEATEPSLIHSVQRKVCPLERCHRHSQLVQKLICEQFQDSALVNKIRTYFPDHCFFAISCRKPGEAHYVSDGGTGFRFDHEGVTDALVWLFWRLGYVPAS